MRSVYRQAALAAALAFTLVAALPLSAFSHGEQVEVSGGQPRGPVSLTAEQIRALGLELVPADLRPIARLLGINGEVAPLPDAQAEVSLRISGNVQAVYASLGDTVRAGQKLALVQSRVVGNPPPTVVVPAPADGVIDARNITVGQSVEPNSTLFHLSDRSRMRVIGKVYEEDLGQVRIGQTAFVKLLAYPDQLLRGTVRFIGPTLDPETRTVEVWVILDNKQGLLKPNLFAQVDIVLGENKAALTVPKAAVLEANGEKFVFVQEGDKFDRVEITVGFSDDQYTEVQSGIVPGDEVVTQGARELYTLWLTGGKN
jgi:multidrug efflux pump subunit AcrA (membrane-fusion protein)